jgi:hypothetical protein
VKGFGGASMVFALLVVAAACGGGGGTKIDIKDFDTARFTLTQTSTADGDTAELTGEGLVDNRQQAVRLTYEGGVGGEVIAIGRTVYSYNEEEQLWESVTEAEDGRVGFGRPYWPQFWLDAVQTEELGGQTLRDVEAVGYRLTFDTEEVAKQLQAPEATEALDVRQAEVEVWVDEESRYAVQLTFRLELALGANSLKLEVTSIFSDFDTEVHIEAPELATPTPAATESAPTEPTPTPAPR